MLQILSRSLFLSTRRPLSARYTSPAYTYSTMSTKDLVETAINENVITIFSKSWCPFCQKAKKVFAESYPDVKTKIFELDELENGDDIQSYLLSKTKQRTVPNVFVNKQHIGGSDDVAAAKSNGKLQALIDEVTASTTKL